MKRLSKLPLALCVATLPLFFTPACSPLAAQTESPSPPLKALTVAEWQHMSAAALLDQMTWRPYACPCPC